MPHVANEHAASQPLTESTASVETASKKDYHPPVLPNWFLAFPIEAPWVVDLPALPPRFRRFAPKDVHATLIFLGACGEAAAVRALTAVRDALSTEGTAPVSVTFSHLVPMGPKREYTALSALLDEGRSTVADLMTRLRDAPADAASVRRDQRTPIPHVTVARPQRRATESDRAAGLAWAARVQLPESCHVLDRVALYTWNEERRETLFRIVDSVPLTSADGRARVS